MSPEPLDNEVSEWRASVKDWLKEGMKIQRRLTTEGDQHRKALAGKRRLARVLARAFRDLGLTDK